MTVVRWGRGRQFHWPMNPGGHFTACGHFFPPEEAMRRDPGIIPAHRQCLRPGCYERWTERARAMEAAQRRDLAQHPVQQERGSAPDGGAAGGGGSAQRPVAAQDGVPDPEGGGHPGGGRGALRDRAGFSFASGGAVLDGGSYANAGQVTFHIQGATPTAVILDETHNWQVTSDTRYARVSTPPPCACGSRTDSHWEHAEEECTWRTA